MEPETIIRTKLHRPALPADLVPRERLIRKLEKYPNRPLTLISAPAGYGKSTLAASWLEWSDCPSAWISLEESDDDIYTFLLYICRAIQSVFPGVLNKLESVLDSTSLPPTQVLAKYLVNGLSEIEEPFMLVIDDYQLISEDSVHELLDRLVSYPVRSMRLAILTRRDPPMPLHIFRSKGKLTEISTKDLKFTPEETKVFLAKAAEIDVEEAHAQILEEKLEGWIVGLRLVSYVLSGKQDPEHFISGLRGSYKAQADYLISEVISSQPGDITGCLLNTSILSRFNAQLCDFLCDKGDSSCKWDIAGQAFISWLLKNNIFIINMDEDGYWFRYHRLFRELLLSRLKQVRSPGEITALHCRASRWFAENDMIDEAIELAIEGGDDDFAIHIIAGNRTSVMNDDKWKLLAGWLDRIPPELKMNNPELLMAQAWVFQISVDISSLSEILGMIEKSLEEDSISDRIRGEYRFFKGYLEYFSGQGSKSLADLKAARKLIPESDEYASGEIEVYYCLAMQMMHGKEKALASAGRFNSNFLKKKQMLRSRLLSANSYVSLIAADLEQAASSAIKIEKIGKTLNRPLTRSMGFYLEAFAHYMWNDRESAISLCSQVVGEQYSTHPRLNADNYAIQALILQGIGQTDRAKEVMESFDEYSELINDPTSAAVVMSCQARLSLLGGDLDSAVRWLRTADLTVDSGLMLWWAELPRITACRVLIAEGTAEGTERAFSTLENYDRENLKIHNKIQSITILPLMAIARFRQNRLDEALAILKKAVGLAKPSHAVRPFIESGPEMYGMLTILIESDGESDFVRKLLDSFKDEKGDALAQPTESPAAVTYGPDEDFLMDPLTHREIEALKHLARGLYYKEIASEMAVSNETVKTHLKHVYQKLYVGGRREAVARARELGIID